MIASFVYKAINYMVISMLSFDRAPNEVHVCIYFVLNAVRPMCELRNHEGPRSAHPQDLWGILLWLFPLLPHHRGLNTLLDWGADPKTT